MTTPVLELGLVYALLALAGLLARRFRTSAVPFFVGRVCWQARKASP